jgi:hypothetical protein
MGGVQLADPMLAPLTASGDQYAAAWLWAASWFMIPRRFVYSKCISAANDVDQLCQLSKYCPVRPPVVLVFRDLLEPTPQNTLHGCQQ